jgi:single-stranded DNA-binding protein
MNTVTLAGKVVGSPVFIENKANNHLLKFSVDDDHKWTKRETNEGKTKTYLHDIVVWGQHGKELYESGLSEGDFVVVQGRVDYHAFKDQGREAKRMQINARQVDVVSKGSLR